MLAVGWSGSTSSTRVMVEGLARLRTRKPEMVDKSIAGITALVANAALAVEAGDLGGLGKLLDLNQMILAGLLLSTGPIEDLCATARAAGALGAKLTGAGGGGSVIALVSDDAAADKVLGAWRGAGFSGFVTRVGASKDPYDQRCWAGHRRRSSQHRPLEILGQARVRAQPARGAQPLGHARRDGDDDDRGLDPELAADAFTLGGTRRKRATRGG